MNKWVLILLLFSLAVNIAVVGTLVYFWHQPKFYMGDRKFRKFEMRDRMHRNFFRDSTMIPENRIEILQLRRDYSRHMKAIQQQIEIYQNELIELLLSDSPNSDSIDIYIQRVTKKQVEAERLTIDHLLSIRPLLPPELWERFVHALQHRNKGMRGMMPGMDRKEIFEPPPPDFSPNYR